MPKSKLMEEEKKGTPSTNTIASASAKGVTQNTAKQISEKAQAVADKYGTQDSRYDMGNPEFAKTVNTYRDQQKQKTIDNLINYRAKVLNSKADVDGDRFEYAGELNKQIAHLQSGDATYSDFNKARDFLADKFDNRKYDRDYTKATSLLNKSDEEIDSYIADMEARESDLSYGHYTDSLGEEGTIDEIKQVQKNIASARNIKEARKMFDAWEVNENYTPFDVLTMNKDGKTVSYDWTDYDTQSKEIDDRIAELTKQMNESDDMIEKAKIMDDIVALQDESIIVADKKNYQDKLISQMLLDSYADTDDVNTFEEVTSLLASRDDNTIQRMGKAGYSALVGAVNTSMNVFDVCKDYLSHKLGSDALNFHPEQFDVNDGENFSTQLRNYEKRLSNESLYGASSTQEAIVKVTNSTVNQLARMPLGQFGSLFTMALQTGAEAYRENLEMGYDRNTALTSAVVNGIITYNVEQIGWQGLEKALNSGAMNYSVGQYLYSLLTNPISEGLEEGVEYIADTWADKLVHPDWIDENGQINGERMAQSLVETLNTSLDGEQIWDAMFLGYLGGFALDTIVATPGFIQSRKQFNAYTQVKANIQQMIQSGMLTQDEVEYYTNTLTAYDIALNAYKGRSFTSDSIQLFSDMVPPLTSVADAEMSLMDSMKPSAEMDAMLEVDTVNKMREAVGIMQQAQQNLLDHGVKMTVTEFAKLSPEERIRVMEEGEHIQATGSSYKFLKTLLDYKGANGEFNKKTGELYLNPTSDETVYVTMIHELTHSLEGSKVYSSIRNMLIDEVGGQEAWDNMVESKRAEYYKKLFDRRSRMGDAYKDFETGDEAQNQKAYELAQFEVVAEQMSKGRSAEAIINKMAKYNRSAFYRMFDNIRNSITNDARSKLETMFVNAVRENNLSRQENSQYSLMEDLPELHKDRAIEEFGTTNDFAKAGYIMNDGRLLDFSGGQPTRMEDHRSISSVFDEEMENGTAYLTAFLNEGNIRILPETGGIDVSEVNEPTDFQYSKIRQFMNEDRDGWHTLDISGADGSTIASVEYPPRTSSQRIINDLKAFYKDGTIPQNNTTNTGLFQYNSNEGTPQFSLASTFQAVGMEITKVGESVVAFNNGEEVKEVTMGMVFRSPMGNMLRMSMDKGFISRADVIKQVKMYTSMLNTVLRTQNPDLIWAIAGSIGYQPAPENAKFNESAPTMHSAFTSNSDTQYGTTFDVTTICTKTQQLIDVASRVMVELDRGLTEEEIINIVYDEVNKAGQPVPCPVCYVFSRWVGSGKLLDSIAKLQDKYVNASTEELEARYKALSKQIDDMAKERGVKGTKARNIVAEQIKEEYDRLSLLKAQKSMLRQSLTEEQENRLASLERDMGILDDWAYLERVRLPSKYNKYHKYDPQKDYVPHDILFDLNKGEQFANEYPYTWAYRTTRGPSMGKAITPYTSQVLGQTIYGVAGSPNGLGKRRSEKYANGKLANAFLSAEITAQAKRKQSDAIKKAKAQNLLGGSRAQSTSDFRFEYVFDYILHFMDLQAIGSKGQTYTKVPEAVPMLASVGYEVNCSLMPFGRGVREVTEDTPNAVQLNDGRWVVLNCSTVTGMNIDDALKFSSIYDNVQPIMVGLNDDHIFACMRDDRITFIIPYHASGGTQARYETMMSELGEIIKAEDRQNYEKSQTDTPLPNATEEQVRRRELRKMILTGKIKEASESDMELIRNSKYLSGLYDRFYVKGVDADCYGVKLSSSQASQIFPFEYWDKTTTFDTADENGRRFWEYCNELGMKPRFAQFGGTDGSEHGYWKMLIDRRMYNNDGTYHEQQAINMSNFNTDYLYRGEMEKGLVQPSKQYKKTDVIDGKRVEVAKYIGDKVIERINQGEYSLKSTFNSDGEDLTTSQMDYFKDTKVVDAEGNLQVTYHGSPTMGITEFDPSKAGSNANADKVGIYFTNDKDFAEDFSYERIPTDSMFFDNRGEKGEVYKAYLNITNPLDFENLTDEDIENLADNYINPSWSFEQKDRLVEELKHARDIGNHQLMKQYLDLSAISEDYDGVIANIENDNSKKEYIVFEPEQIKSTDNLNPTGNRDIRYSLSDQYHPQDFEYHTLINLQPRKHLRYIQQNLNKVSYTDLLKEAKNNALKIGAISRDGNSFDIEHIDGGTVHFNRDGLTHNKVGKLTNIRRNLIVHAGEIFKNSVKVNEAYRDGVYSSVYMCLYSDDKDDYIARFIVQDGDVKHFDNALYAMSAKEKSKLPTGWISPLQFATYTVDELLKIVNSIPEMQFDLPLNVLREINTSNFSINGLSSDIEGLKYSLQDNDDYGYHYGAKELDYNRKSETLWRRPGRSTGAFGTGIYLFGDGRLDEPSFTSKGTEHKIDLSNYNLFKPQTNRDGFKLHDFFKALDDNYSYTGVQTSEEYNKKLSAIRRDLRNFDGDNTTFVAPMTSEQVEEFRNRLLELENEYDVDKLIDNATSREGQTDAWELEYEIGKMNEGYSRGRKNVRDIMHMYEQIPDMAIVLGTSTEELRNIVNNAMESARADSEQPDFRGGNYDSVGTRVMKALGYEGIDVRHLDRLDNSRYGSVIYDLKPETVRYSLNDSFESQVPEEVQNQLDADSLAEVDAINKDAKKMARRQSILTKKQQESFERISNYDKDLVSTGEKATLDEVESDVKDMIKNDRIKDIKKNGFVESDAEAWEQYNKQTDEEIKNITSHTTSVEDANDNLKGIARILDENPKLKSETSKQTWRYYRDLFVKEFVDHGRAVYRLAKEVKDPLLYALYDYAQNVDNIVGRMFANKRVDLQTGEVIGKGFDEVFTPIRDSGLSREFQNYMYHKLNIDRMTLSERFSTEFTDEDGKISFLTLPNKPVFNKVVTAKMSQEFCDRMEAEHPEFLEWAKDVYEYEDAELSMLVKSGRLSQEQMKMLKERYPHYVPISREMDMKPFVTDEQVVSSNRAVKRATGGTANINPLEYAMQKHSRDVYSTILHNDLYWRIGQYYEMPVDAEFEQETDYKIDTMGNEVQPAQGENPPTLIYYENGERYVIEIDLDLYEALLPRNFAPDLPFVNGISNLRRNLITGWNPVFMFTNGIKDFQDAQFNTKFSPVEFNSAYAQAWKEILTNGKLYQMYLNLGGEYNSYFRNDDGKVEGKGVPILGKVIALNEKVEIAPRLAEFICSLRHDMSTAEAMYNASDITTNFKRGGRTAKWMNRNGFNFLNASIQGFDKQVRNITDAKDKEGWKGVAKYMAKLSIINAIPLVILNGLVWDDDDEYAELSDYIKHNYYIIGKYGEGKFIRIPKGRIASFYQTVMENAVNNDERKSMWDNLMNDLADDMESFMNNVAPNNPIDNNLLAPLIQAHTNTAWYGDDIVPTRLQDERPSEQYDDSTDALSRSIGQFSRKVAEQTGSSLFELSPYKINYLLDQYTGMLGDFGLPMLTPRAENRIDNQLLSGLANPLLDKFTTDSTLKNQRVTDFYAMKEELNKLASSSDATEEQILASKFMNSVSGEMSQLYKDKRAIQSDTSIPNSEKFDEARNIQEQIINLAKKGLTGYDQIDIRGENATVGDVEYKKSSGGDWAKTKTRDFSQYYSTYGLDEDKQSQFKSAMEMTSKKDENGKTVRNSEALATRKALEEMGEYENVLKYIEENGLEYKDFDLNKTVVGYDESKFSDKYNAVYETQEASAEPKSTSYTPRRNASQNGSNESEEDFFSTLLSIINAPVSTNRSGLSANVAQVFKEGQQRSKSIRSNRDDLRKAIAKAKRKYNL